MTQRIRRSGATTHMLEAMKRERDQMAAVYAKLGPNDQARYTAKANLDRYDQQIELMEQRLNAEEGVA